MLPRLLRLSSVKRIRFNAYGTSSIDEREVKTFGEGYVDDWWDTNGATKLLHRMNKLRVPLIRDGTLDGRKPARSVSILDVGCGAGILSEALARLGFVVHGADVVPHLHRVAKDHAKLDPSLTNLQYHLKSVENFAKDDAGKYDAVVVSEVIEHVLEQDRFLEECVRCVKPGGSVFVTTFHKTSFAWFVSIVYFEYVMRYIPRGTHHWDKFISLEDTTKILEKHNCKIVKVENWNYGQMQGEWRHARRVPITYAVHAVKN